ncbi:hypothetical protein LIA77_11457 [Sarocladium implicatum]|nr:hypothetical protein LIA77_11457 [Sarocladium implicatum]
MKELLERLAACEERLKHCNCHEVQNFTAQTKAQHHYDYQHHQHSHHGAPPSPPASAASRDAAIANMLDHSGDEEDVKERYSLSRYSEIPHFGGFAATTELNKSDMRAEGT